eukprot:gene8293-8479_t
MAEHIAAGDRAFVDEEYEEALSHYSRALEAAPSADAYEARANANIKVERYMDAVQDATKALELDGQNAKAYLRKGTACFHLEEYETALQAFLQGQELAPSDKKFSKYQWYQLGSKVVIDVYAKNQPKDAVAVQLSDDNSKLRIVIAAQQEQPLSSSAGASEQAQQHEAAEHPETYTLELELFGQVAPEVKVEVLKTKVEITMQKAAATSSWRSLEKSSAGPAPAGVGAAAVPAAEPAAPRSYPSSSKSHKDWSKVEAEVNTMEEKGELDDADPLGAFFKKIFSQGDDDTRRAMMKSFVESNGTVLSTNWKEVGTKKVDCTPPEGMELHKWNE